MDNKAKALLELEMIEHIIKTGSVWDGLVNNLSNLLLKKYGDEEKEVIANTIRFIVSEKDKLSKADIKAIVKDLEDGLGGGRLYQLFKRDIESVQLKSYTKGFEDSKVGIDFQFNKTDKDVLYWLSRSDAGQFWIGESYSKQLNERLEKLTEEILKQGLGRIQAGELIWSHFESEYNKTRSYWELMAEHTVTRSREFGRLSGFEKAGVEFVKVDAIIDSRTSFICRNLDGRIIEVSKLIDQRTNLLKARSVEEVKTLAPWYSKKEIIKHIAGTPDNKLPSGVGCPPYHAFCRTVLVIAYDEEIKTSQAYNEVLSKPEIREAVKKYIEAGTDNYNPLIPINSAGLIHYFTANPEKAEAINGKIRAGAKDKFSRAFETALNDAINRFPDYPGKSYRFFNSLDSEGDRRVISKIKEGIGTEISDPGFITANIRPDLQKEGTRYKILINSETGKRIDSVSKYGGTDPEAQNDAGIIFPSGSRFKIVKIEEIKNLFGEVTETKITLNQITGA